jgi:hypothetical protein
MTAGLTLADWGEVGADDVGAEVELELQWPGGKHVGSPVGLELGGALDVGGALLDGGALEVGAEEIVWCDVGGGGGGVYGA